MAKKTTPKKAAAQPPVKKTPVGEEPQSDQAVAEAKVHDPGSTLLSNAK